MNSTQFTPVWQGPVKGARDELGKIASTLNNALDGFRYRVRKTREESWYAKEQYTLDREVADIREPIGKIIELWKTQREGFTHREDEILFSGMKVFCVGADYPSGWGVGIEGVILSSDEYKSLSYIAYELRREAREEESQKLEVSRQKEDGEARLSLSRRLHYLEGLEEHV